jgi:flagellar biosynthesis protein FlhG
MHEAYVIQDQATHLRALVSKVAQRERTVKPYVVAVVSGKGGVGKSTLALNTSIALNDFGYHVLLIDADHNLGNLHVMLGATPKMGLADVLRGERDIEDVLLRPQPCLSFLPGCSGDFDYPSFDERSIHAFLHDVRTMDIPQQCVIIDLSAGVAHSIITTCLAADEVLVVTNDEPTSVIDAYAVIKMIIQEKSDHPISLLVNSSYTPGESDETARKLTAAVQHFLHRSIRYLGSVPHDRHLPRAIHAQVPFLRLFPSSAAALSIIAIAKKFAQTAPFSNKGFIK